MSQNLEFNQVLHCFLRLKIEVILKLLLKYINKLIPELEYIAERVEK